MRRTVAWIAFVLVAAVGLVGCGGRSGGSTLSAVQAQKSLRAAGWRVRAAAGMPHTYAGVRQVAWLEATTPRGDTLELQFRKDMSKAQRELTAARNHDPGFAANVIDNVMVCRQNGEAPVGEQNLTDLRRILSRV